MPPDQEQGQQQQQQQGQDSGGGSPPESWEQWLEAQAPEVKALYEQHTTGLKSALTSERDQRKDLAKQLQEMAKKAEEGSDARKALEEMAGRLEEAERRASFVEEAAAQGVANPRLAYIAAKDAGVFDSRGNVNWDALRKQFPEIFQKEPPARGHAGSGTGNPPPGQPVKMDDIIRRKAGVIQ